MNHIPSDSPKMDLGNQSTSYLLTKENFIQHVKCIQEEDVIGQSSMDALGKIIRVLSINTVSDMIQPEISQLKREIISLEEEGQQEVANAIHLLISSASQLHVSIGGAVEACSQSDR